MYVHKYLIGMPLNPVEYFNAPILIDNAFAQRKLQMIPPMFPLMFSPNGAKSSLPSVHMHGNRTNQTHKGFQYNPSQRGDVDLISVGFKNQYAEEPQRRRFVVSIVNILSLQIIGAKISS